jgi:hypothetical protein
MSQVCSPRGGNVPLILSFSRNNGREGTVQGPSMSVKRQLAKQEIRRFLVRILAGTPAILADVFFSGIPQTVQENSGRGQD